jgi:hypothetical protein
MYFSKGGILYHYVRLSKRKGPLLAFKGGRAHYWFSNKESTFKMHLFTLSPVLKGGGTIALYFTPLKLKKKMIFGMS